MKKIYILILCAILMISCHSEKKKSDHTNETQIVKKITIPAGSSLYNELSKEGLSATTITDLITAIGNEVDIQTVQPNSQFDLILDKENKSFKELIYYEDLITSHRVYFESDSYQYQLIEKETEKKTRFIEGIVYQSLDLALSEKKIEARVRNEIMGALSSKVNFRTQAKNGDMFSVLLEENYYQNQKLPGTKVLYVSYKGKSVPFFEGFRYEESDKKSAFNGLYLANGVAMLSAHLRLPLDRIQITSRFGYRIHPISRRRKMHNGIDYRARTGTPVYAITNGIVVRSSWYGGYGKTVEIRHQDGHVSQYAHLHRINVKKGQPVRSGQVVGSVGSTGYSTGPHLHFGIRNNRSWINPANFKMTSATKLNSARLSLLKKQIEDIKPLVINSNTSINDPMDTTVLENYRRENTPIYKKKK